MKAGWQGGFIPLEENRVDTGADYMQTDLMKEYKNVMYEVCVRDNPHAHTHTNCHKVEVGGLGFILSAEIWLHALCVRRAEIELPSSRKQKYAALTANMNLQPNPYSIGSLQATV